MSVNKRPHPIEEIAVIASKGFRSIITLSLKLSISFHPISQTPATACTSSSQTLTMHRRNVPLPPPTADRTETALEHASKLHYAFALRPPVGSPSRTRWERRFKRDLAALILQLASAQFSELPALAIGCIWEHNRSHAAGAAPFDIESIRPAHGDHPALVGPGRLRYKDGGDGPNGLIPEERLLSVWWDEFRQGKQGLISVIAICSSRLNVLLKKLSSPRKPRKHTVRASVPVYIFDPGPATVCARLTLCSS